jgi:hypothetical protein
LPVAGRDEAKRTNEIGMAIPLLAHCDIAGKDITADALLTQRALATYIVGQQAAYHFTVKGNQPTLQRDIGLLFENRQTPDFVEVTPPDHGRIETRRIWCSSALNAYIDFPHVGQVFLIERETLTKKTGELRREIALGMTSRSAQQASPQQVLAINRGHWSVESVLSIRGRCGDLSGHIARTLMDAAGNLAKQHIWTATSFQRAERAVTLA